MSLRSVIAKLFEPLTLLVLAQVLFIAVGKSQGDFNISYFGMALAVGSACVTEVLARLFEDRMRNRDHAWRFPWSACATGLGIAIFFRAISPWLYVVAGFIAIASKYLIRVRGKHIFNPSNFAIVLLIFLSPFPATVEFTQWGSDPWIFGAISLIALGIAFRAGVLSGTLSFLTTYTAILVALLPFAPERFASHHYGLIGPTLILFASFMITDPKTAPKGTTRLIIHGAAIACMYFTLEAIGIRYSLFLASFLVSLLNAISAWIKRRPESKRLLRSRADLWAVAVLSAIACIGANGALLAGRPMTFPWSSIAPEFLMMGIESPALRTCKDPFLQPDTTSGIVSSGSTYGAAWGDYDGDGYDDLFVSNMSGEGSRLYHNMKDGKFIDTTAYLNLPTMYSSNAAFVPLERGGPMDLIVAEQLPATNTAPQMRLRIFKYEKTGFKEVTDQFGLSNFRFDGQGAGFAFADLTHSGRLDMIVTSEGSWISREGSESIPMQKVVRDPFFSGPQYTREFAIRCGKDTAQATVSALPEVFPDATNLNAHMNENACLLTVDYISSFPAWLHLPSLLNDRVIFGRALNPGSAYLFENTGHRFVQHPDFTKVLDDLQRKTGTELGSTDRPFMGVSGRFFQPITYDFFGRGLPDVFIATDVGRNVYLKNEGGFRFSEVAMPSLLRFSTGMGVTIADFHGTGKPDLFVTNESVDYLFENTGATFTLDSSKNLGKYQIGWGTAALDYDLDGHDDIYIANGIASDFALSSPATRTLFREDDLYHNAGEGTFTNATGAALCAEPHEGKTVAVSDADQNGTPDVYVGTLDAKNVLYLDTIAGKQYLGIRLKGTISNALGIGASVTVTSAQSSQTKFLVLGSGFGTENSAELLFGLGTSSAPVKVTIHWPSGIVQQVQATQIDRVLTITERK